MTTPTKAENPSIVRLERHEKRWRERNWKHFAMTHRGRLSWADWFRSDALLAQRSK